MANFSALNNNLPRATAAVETAQQTAERLIGCKNPTREQIVERARQLAPAVGAQLLRALLPPQASECLQVPRAVGANQLHILRAEAERGNFCADTASLVAACDDAALVEIIKSLDRPLDMLTQLIADKRHSALKLLINNLCPDDDPELIDLMLQYGMQQHSSWMVLVLLQRGLLGRLCLSEERELEAMRYLHTAWQGEPQWRNSNHDILAALIAHRKFAHRPVDMLAGTVQHGWHHLTSKILIAQPHLVVTPPSSSQSWWEYVIDRANDDTHYLLPWHRARLKIDASAIAYALRQQSPNIASYLFALTRTQDDADEVTANIRFSGDPREADAAAASEFYAELIGAVLKARAPMDVERDFLAALLPHARPGLFAQLKAAGLQPKADALYMTLHAKAGETHIIERLQALRDLGAIANRAGETPLVFAAARCGLGFTLQALVGEDSFLANARHGSDTLLTALLSAEKGDFSSIFAGVSHILRVANLSVQTSLVDEITAEGSTALHMAAARRDLGGQEAIITALLRAGASPNQLDGQKRTFVDVLISVNDWPAGSEKYQNLLAYAKWLRKQYRARRNCSIVYQHMSRSAVERLGKAVPMHP